MEIHRIVMHTFAIVFCFHELSGSSILSTPGLAHRAAMWTVGAPISALAFRVTVLHIKASRTQGKCTRWHAATARAGRSHPHKGQTNVAIPEALVRYQHLGIHVQRLLALGYPPRALDIRHDLPDCRVVLYVDGELGTALACDLYRSLGHGYTVV